MVVLERGRGKGERRGKMRYLPGAFHFQTFNPNSPAVISGMCSEDLFSTMAWDYVGHDIKHSLMVEAHAAEWVFPADINVILPGCSEASPAPVK